LMRERYDASDKACRLRFHTQTGGSTLTAQQPLNNVVRVAYQALSAVLGGTQSLHTNSFDEALALPSEESALLAVRTQQILAYESGVTQTADPLAGSYYLEALTDALESEVREYLKRVEELGGAARAVEYMKEEIHRAAYDYQLSVENGTRKVVGVNAFSEEGSIPEIRMPDFLALESAQKEGLRARKVARDPGLLRGVLEAVRAAANSEENLLPPIIQAVKGSATLGEISHVLREEWGSFDEG